MSLVFASLSNQRICSASQALSEFERLGFDSSSFAGIANSYHCPVGSSPGSAFLLMRRGVLENLTPTEFNTLTLGAGAESVSIKQMCLCGAKRLTPGKSHDPNSLYLLELRDKRWLLQRTGMINRRYNVREWEDVEDVYRSDTINNSTGDAWTWEEVFEDLWGDLESAIVAPASGGGGSYSFSGLNPELNSVPENLFYENVSAWDALDDAVRRCGCELKLDPTTGAVSIIQMGAYQSSSAPTWFDAGGTWEASDPGWGVASGSKTERKVGDLLTYDGEVFTGPWRVPKKVRVVFPSNMPNHGTYGSSYHKTVDGSTLDLGSYWTVDPISDGYTDTEEIIHDGTTAIFQNTSASSPTNAGALSDRADEVATDFYIRLFSGTSERLEFSGIKPYLPGANIHATTWGDTGGGMMTVVERRPPGPVKLMPRRDFPVRQSRGVKFLGVEITNDEGTLSMTGGFKVDGTETVGGQFKLSWKGKRTDAIQIDDSGSTIESKLTALSNIGSGNITVTGGPLTTDDVVIYFSGDLFEEDAAEIKVHYGKVTGGYLDRTIGDTVPCALLENSGETSFDVIDGTLVSEHWAPGLKSTMIRDGQDWYTSPSYAMYGCRHAGYADDSGFLTVKFSLSTGGSDFSNVFCHAENISTEDDADWEDQMRDLWGYPFNGGWKVLPQDCPPEG